MDSDLRLLLIDLDMHLRECVRLGLSAAEAYDSAYQETVATALAAQPVQAQGYVCQACAGSGEVEGMGGQGPDTYSVTVPCGTCGGTGELFTHAEDCADELCALNGDEHSCTGRVEPCVCCAPAPAVDRGLSEAAQQALKALDLTLLHLERGDIKDAFRREGFAAQAKSHASSAADALRAALAASAEPIGWAQLGMLNGRTYIRETYDRTPYPPPADVVRNLNLVPVYGAPSQAGSCQASGEAQDFGPWQASGDGRVLTSADPVHDVKLTIDGDFALARDRVHYADRLAYRLSRFDKDWIPTPPAGRTLTDDELRSMWREAGGFFYGPNVEHGAMPEAKLLPYLRAILAASSTTAGERDHG